MMRFKHLIVICLWMGFLQGCVNHLYTGKIFEKDSADVNREFVLYWTKTDPLIGADKAGPAVLLTQCSPRKISFDEQDNGIVFLGDPGTDSDAIRNAPVPSQDYICGQFNENSRFVDIQEGDLSLSVFCKPVTDDFSVMASSQTYLKAREEPYTFEISKTKKWSFVGEALKAPPPECPPSP